MNWKVLLAICLVVGVMLAPALNIMRWMMPGLVQGLLIGLIVFVTIWLGMKWTKG